MASLGCRRPAVPAPPAGEISRPSTPLRVAEKRAVLAQAPAPLKRCYAGDLPGSPPRPLAELLARSTTLLECHDDATALACSEEAARIDPRSIAAHHDRAMALQELGRLDEAHGAIMRALALDPSDAETLAGVAELYINYLAPSNDHSEAGLEFARRAVAHAKRNRQLLQRLALLEGQALNDLGRSREALARLDAAAIMQNDIRIRYERGVALFELCRLDEAERAFREVIAQNPGDAWAHHHLGLILERQEHHDQAALEFERARGLAPAEFPLPVMLTHDEFRTLVENEIAGLPAGARRDLQLVQLEIADLPNLTDLIAEDPPLSPTILGLFRGVPLSTLEANPDEPRTIILYRKNLGRAVASKKELATQIRTTLLHELGHLRGEVDDELRAHGLE